MASDAPRTPRVVLRSEQTEAILAFLRTLERRAAAGGVHGTER